MSKIKEKAAVSVSQASSAYTQLDTFSHLFERNNVPVNGKDSYTIDQAGDQITRTHHQWSDADNSGKVELTYTFLKAPGSSLSAFGVSGFSQFNTQQKAQAVLAMQSWADVANVTFTEKASGGDGHMSFGNYSTGMNGAGAFAVLPGTAGIHDGESWYNSSQSVNVNPTLNNYGRQTLTHEIGHTLGLSHPGDYNAGPNSGPLSYDNASYAQDTRAYTVMSYWSETSTGQNFSGAYSSGPLMDDIAAIQKLYGANTTTRTGDTTYGFNSNTGRDFLSASTSTDKLVFSVWDAGGKDTLDFSGFTKDQKINLNEGSFSNVGGLVGNVSIAKGVTLENATGGSGNDLLLGNAVANELKGGAGNDLLYGGGGADKLWGGAGKDVFVFGQVSDSTATNADKILDFTSGQDKIDVSNILATLGNASLHFVSAFTGSVGDAVLSYDQASNQGSLAIDFSGHGVADFLVSTVGQAAVTDIAA